MDFQAIISELEKQSDPAAVEGMARFGIRGGKIYGLSMPQLRQFARVIGKNHELALRLWEHESRETRILASLIDIPDMADGDQMENWVKTFDTWEICDQCCMNLFEKTSSAWTKAHEWGARGEEFVKRAGFVLMARLAVSDRYTPDVRFEEFFPIMIREAEDSRNFVRKAVNWALREIGKRNAHLHELAIACALRIKESASGSARWIASDALRELRNEAIIARMLNRKSVRPSLKKHGKSGA
jgi:3-methyladenine DNA glycosylase AlkD